METELNLNGFVRFTNNSGRQSILGPYVTYYKNPGRFMFNTAAINQFGLNNFNYLQYAYDEERQLIGFKFSVDAEDGSYKVSKRSKCPLAASGKLFMKWFGINCEIKKAKLKKLNDNFFYIDISKFIIKERSNK